MDKSNQSFSSLSLSLPSPRHTMLAARAAAARNIFSFVPRRRSSPSYASAGTPLIELRAHNDFFVDKTAAIADFLAGGGELRRRRAFFARPRKFGKSLMLDIAAQMLAAGALPARAAPWPGYAPVDVDAVFGGLAVHARLRARDPALHGLLERAHFVIRLWLGAATGTELKGAIIDELAGVAERAFGAALEAEVRAAASPCEALEVVLRAVPHGVPVAVLVNKYDYALVHDLSDDCWAAAADGMAALRSLMSATKEAPSGWRIERFIVSGVTRLSPALLAGAADFVDLTGDPLLSRAIGFSEAEIRATFPAELERLAATLKTGADGAVAELARWHGGYCFDGATTCLYPFPVLAALDAGEIAQKEAEGASESSWLGIAPRVLVEPLTAALLGGAPADASRACVADLPARRVDALPLLLQLGLLSPTPGRPTVVRPPNAFAVQSLQRMARVALAVESADFGRMAAALRARDRAAFAAAAAALIGSVSRRRPEAHAGAVRARALRKADCLGGLVLAMCLPSLPGVFVSARRGTAGVVVVKFGGPQAAAWVIRLAFNCPGGAAATLVRWQTERCQGLRAARAFGAAEVHCCALVVKRAAGASAAGGGRAVAVDHAWARHTAEGWAPAEAAPPPA